MTTGVYLLNSPLPPSPYIQIIWRRLYKTGSSKEGGTLLQLKNVINRQNVGSTNDISKRVNEVEDFLELVITCHLIAAALHYFSMESVSDPPHSNGFPCEILQMDLSERRKIFHSRMETIIKEYVIPKDFSTHQHASSSQALPPIHMQLASSSNISMALCHQLHDIGIFQSQSLSLLLGNSQARQ